MRDLLHKISPQRVIIIVRNAQEHMQICISTRAILWLQFEFARIFACISGHGMQLYTPAGASRL